MDVKISSIQPATDVRKKLFDILFSLENNLEEAVVVTLKNKPQAVIISYELFDSLLETIDVLSDEELMKDIRRAEKDKDFIPFEEVIKTDYPNFSVHDIKKKYGISSTNGWEAKKRSKKTKPKYSK